MDASTTYLPGKNHAPQQLGRVLILGLGKSGKAAAQYCLALLGQRVQAVHIAGGEANDDSRAFAQAASEQGATVAFDTTTIDGTYDLGIVSPGIPQTSEFYQNAAAACTELISEVEFAWRECSSDARWIAITGTNGKTTTTALCAHLLQASGMRAMAVGNIGDTCLEAVAADSSDVYVAEVSSYQLASTIRFAPDVAVLMNITPDHLAWHGGFDAYVQAKAQVFANLATRPHGWAVLDATNDTVRAFVREMKAQGSSRGFSYVPMGTSEGIGCDMRQACGSEHAAFVRSDGMMVVALDEGEVELCPATSLQIPGAHNVGNALLAATAALCLGADVTSVSQGLQSFTSLAHRIEACGTVGGVRFYNDSKATNVDATLKAFAAFDPERPIVLLGGRDKNTELESLVAAAQQHAKAVVLYGESQQRFAQAFATADIPVYNADHMASALEVALDTAGEGDIVLLSPACASFDEFTSFEQRGDVFKELVTQYASRIE